MPIRPASGQPDSATAWFGSDAGEAVLASERPTIFDALSERPGQPWLWIAPLAPSQAPEGRGLALRSAEPGWTGAVRCALPLPLPSETFGTVVLQHVAGPGPRIQGLLEEGARILVPGGQLWLFALNPLAPYRWRWRGEGLRAAEPLTWRRRLRAAGLVPDAVSRGIGPSWRVAATGLTQSGPGLRAAYALRAEKRVAPLTPLRAAKPLRLSQGVQAG